MEGQSTVRDQLVAVAVAGALATLSGFPTPGAAPAVAPVSTVNVGTFNVANVSADKTIGERRPWKTRRSAVISEILREKIDVLGVQEVNPSTSSYRSRLVDGANQYLDLRNGLNRAGGSYALANSWRSVSLDNRILYNTSKLTKVTSNGLFFAHQTPNKTKRTMAWGVFRVNSTGDQFLFVTLHLDNYEVSSRVAQWNEMINKVDAIKGNLPVVIGGDFNTTKCQAWGTAPTARLVRDGIPGVLNGELCGRAGYGLRPDSIVNAWMASFNAFTRTFNATRNYWADRNLANPRTGNSVDHIFASKAIDVKSFEVVVNANSSNSGWAGTIPSDHNLLKATIALP